ncbi:DUF4160 domain-containing protein [Paraburkholderia franconis]|nr:DUF4160 domain-containing protein [Paraburkholderia franconis]
MNKLKLILAAAGGMLTRLRPKRGLNLQSLRDALEEVDRISREQSGYLYKLLVARQQIKLKMYQERGHSRAHFHVDYGQINHAAVFAVDTGERIEGNLDRKYDRAITAWTIANRKALLAIWSALQSGESETPFIRSLTEIRYR